MSDHEFQKGHLLNGFPVQDYESLLTSVFPEDNPNSPILGATDDVEIAPNLTSLLHDNSLIVVSLEDDGHLIGCSIAMPIDKMDPSRSDEAKDTAYIYYTAISPDRQGVGLVGTLMDSLFQKLEQEGYTYLERDCVIANGYADNVQKNNEAAIVESYDHTNFPEFGPERFFRIKLGKAAVRGSTSA